MEHLPVAAYVRGPGLFLSFRRLSALPDAAQDLPHPSSLNQGTLQTPPGREWEGLWESPGAGPSWHRAGVGEGQLPGGLFPTRVCSLEEITFLPECRQSPTNSYVAGAVGGAEGQSDGGWGARQCLHALLPTGDYLPNQLSQAGFSGSSSAQCRPSDASLASPGLASPCRCQPGTQVPGAAGCEIGKGDCRRCRPWDPRAIPLDGRGWIYSL